MSLSCYTCVTFPVLPIIRQFKVLHPAVCCLWRKMFQVKMPSWFIVKVFFRILELPETSLQIQIHAGCSSSHSPSSGLALFCFFFLSFLRKVWASRKLQTFCCKDKTRGDAMLVGRGGNPTGRTGRQGVFFSLYPTSGCLHVLAWAYRERMCWKTEKQEVYIRLVGTVQLHTTLNWINITDSWAINPGWTPAKPLRFSTLNSLRWRNLALIYKSTTWLPTDWPLFMLYFIQA